MSKLNLRAISKSQVSWRQAQAGWRARGVDVGLALLPKTETLVMVNADDGEWQALINPREWLAQAAPQLAAMAAAVCDIRQIMALFNSTPNPLTFDDGALTYRHLQAQETDASMQDGGIFLPRLVARECSVWLEKLAPRRLDKLKPSYHAFQNLPLAVKFTLGASVLPIRQAAALNIGDVVLISTLMRQIICQGRRIGHFCQKEEMIMIDESYEENHDEIHDEIRDDVYQDYSLSDSDRQRSSAYAPLPGAINEAPLNVEFILQRRFMSVREVQALFSGQVLEMDPACEQKIELRSNGHLLARGELVQLEDRLGVEIMELSSDKSNAI